LVQRLHSTVRPSSAITQLPPPSRMAINGCVVTGMAQRQVLDGHTQLPHLLGCTKRGCVVTVHRAQRQAPRRSHSFPHSWILVTCGHRQHGDHRRLRIRCDRCQRTLKRARRRRPPAAPMRSRGARSCLPSTCPPAPSCPLPSPASVGACSRPHHIVLSIRFWLRLLKRAQEEHSQEQTTEDRAEDRTEHRPGIGRRRLDAWRSWPRWAAANRQACRTRAGRDRLTDLARAGVLGGDARLLMEADRDVRKAQEATRGAIGSPVRSGAVGVERKMACGRDAARVSWRPKVSSDQRRLITENNAPLRMYGGASHNFFHAQGRVRRFGARASQDPPPRRYRRGRWSRPSMPAWWAVCPCMCRPPT
jgi:hypothetical protein